ncbi:hypothetical protein E2897_08115, partial [Campylobacter coli]|nr:hypothetical protein [Campylobacter coli]
SNIDLENFKFFNNNYKGSEISRELDTFIKKSNLKEIGETFEYNFNYKNKNNITLREQIYKFYEHDIFVIADKLAILGDDDKDFTKIFIINQKKLPNHIQELLKDFKFNENYLSSIANHKSHFYFQLDLVKHSKNNEFLTTLDSLKNVNSLFELDELKPTKNIQNYNYDQIMEKRLRR